MTVWLKAAAVLVTAGSLTGAVLIGGGTPPSPARVAEAAGQAARNTRIAARNAEQAAEGSEALARIMRNVRSQLESSRRLLRIQLRIEGSSEESVDLARALEDRIAALGGVVEDLASRVRRLVDLSSAVQGSVVANDRAAAGLERSLRELARRYRDVTRESRELARKARGYERLQEGP